MATLALTPLELAALLTSRVCHDVIGPVSAIINGLELMELEEDEAMRKSALELIERSAQSASSKLQFCRLAFGASGSAGSEIETGEAEAAARGLIESERTRIAWSGISRRAPKNKLKTLLNLCLVASSCIPRGGQLSVEVNGDGPAFSFHLQAKGPNPRIPSHVAELIAGEDPGTPVDAHTVVAYYAGLLARDSGLVVKFEAGADAVEIQATSIGAEPSAVAGERGLGG